MQAALIAWITIRLWTHFLAYNPKRNPTMNSLEKIVAGYGLTVKEFFAKMPD